MKQTFQTILLASGTLFLTILLIMFPEQVFDSSMRGLNIWWKIVFPSLLPFFIMSELLIGFGVVKFIGVLLEPIMRPLFNVPGAGSFAWVMGMASGYPSGAKISTRLREEKHLTQLEAERLVSFTNNASPLFILGAVSIGIFNDAKLGILLAVCHYGGNALVGLCMRFHGRSKETPKKLSNRKKVSLSRAFKEMHQTRIKDTRPFGKILGDAVINSIQTLMMVGGFIILFSVLSRLLYLTGITSNIAILFQVILQSLSLPAEFSVPFIAGLFEITLGSQHIADIGNVSMLHVAIILSFILGFNGFSVQAQVSSIIAKTDIRFTPYFISRLLHGLIGSILATLLFKPIYMNRQTIEDVTVQQPAQTNYWIDMFNYLAEIGPPLTIISLGVSIIILLNRKWHQSM